MRGFRVELGEIEAHLGALAGVREAVVVVRADRIGEKRLVAYVTGEGDGTLESGSLRASLAAQLPDYMVPSSIVILASLPLTANGKVDRRALPEPQAGAYARGEHVAPRTEIERRLCEIWQEVLGVERVGIEDGFFDLGGHSLLATRVVSRVRADLSRELPLRAIFEHPTIAGLVASLPDLSGGFVLPPIAVLAERQNLALSYAQQRLWFIDRLEGGTSHYNIAGAVRLLGGLDERALARALATVVERHESLRTVFRQVGGTVCQVILADAALGMALQDLSGLGEAEREREVRQTAADDARRPFDLSRDLMLRARLLRLGEAEHVMLLNMHHIAADGWSMGVLLREIKLLYEAYAAGAANPLEPLRVQYADYAQWQRQWLQGEVLEGQLNHWRHYLEALPVVHALPLDEARPARQSFDGAQHLQRLGRPVS